MTLLLLYIVAFASLLFTVALLAGVALGHSLLTPRSSRIVCALLLPGAIINVGLLVLRLTRWGIGSH